MFKRNRFDDLPDIDGGRLQEEGVVLEGQMFLHPLGLAETDRRVKHLKLVLASHRRAIEIAAEHEVVWVEEDEKLTMTGGDDRGRWFVLDCWRDPVLRKFFDILELQVVEAIDVN